MRMRCCLEHRRILRSTATVILERNLYLGSVDDFAGSLRIDEVQIQLGDLSDANILQTLRCHPNSAGGGILPRLLAGSDQLDHFVHTLGHDLLLLSKYAQVLSLVHACPFLLHHGLPAPTTAHWVVFDTGLTPAPQAINVRGSHSRDDDQQRYAGFLRPNHPTGLTSGSFG